MLYKNYFTYKKINQEILNKKINWYYDIKSILYQEDSNFKKESLDYAKIIKKNYLYLKNKKIKKKLIEKKIIVKDLKNAKFIKNDKSFKKDYLNLFKYLKKKNIIENFKHFCVHGSIASNDYVKGWSDFDTFVVLKDNFFNDINSIIKLRNNLKIFYKKLLKLSYFQHHGLIIYTELDLNNYLKGYLPKEALEKSFSILGNQNIILKENYSNTNLSLKSLIDRKKYLKEGVDMNFYNHHTFKGNKLQIPLKSGRNQMYQLFCHLGYMLNIPILYFDATRRSIHKKKSFKKFYSEIQDKNIINLIKKTEKVRKDWKKHRFENKRIPHWVINQIGSNYMKNSYLTVSKIIKLIRNYNLDL